MLAELSMFLITHMCRTIHVLLLQTFSICVFLISRMFFHPATLSTFTLFAFGETAYKTEIRIQPHVHAVSSLLDRATKIQDPRTIRAMDRFSRDVHATVLAPSAKTDHPT